MCPLSMCLPGDRVIIRSIAGGMGIRRKLADMGFYPGEELSVVNSRGGPVIVNLKGTRVGVGRNMARKIFVSVSQE